MERWKESGGCSGREGGWGGSELPVRESCEVRTVAFFEDGTERGRL